MGIKKKEGKVGRFVKRLQRRLSPESDREKNNKGRVLNQLLPVGFHGDEYLLGLVDSLIKGCEYFIETGANVGTTLAYVARKFPRVKCLSCEPDRDAFNEAVKNTAEYANVEIYNLTSQDFINLLKNEKRDLFSKECLFWLDAHGYGFEWPMKDELSFITSSFDKGLILIDDFKVPGLDCFKYDVYKDQVCSFDFVKGSLNPKHCYRLYYPAYTDRTSRHHPLTGWGLIEFGHEKEIELPEELKGKVKGMFKDVRITHTQHPLDSGGDREITVDIDMSSKTSPAAEDPDLVTPFRMSVAQRLKAEYEKRRYPAADFRHYKALWNGVNGWLTYEQAEWLFEAAKKRNPDGDIVEIGSSYGRSTVCLGLGVSISGNGKIYSVDPHIGGKGFREQLKDKDRYNSFDGFRENLKRFEVETEVVPVVKTSEDALKDWKGQKIRLLFIDGWHTYDAVTHDILCWEKHVVEGGLIALHDYQEENVRRAIHDCLRKLGINEKELEFVNKEMVFFAKQKK